MKGSPTRCRLASLAAVLKLHKPISWFPPIWTLACGVILSAAPIVANRASLLGVKTAERFVEGLPGPRSPSDRAAPKRGTPDCRRAETPLSLRSGVALSRPDRRSNNSRWRAQAGPGILAAGVAALSEELHTESHRSVADQTEMPLPSELSTVFLGGLFLLALLAAVYAAREIVLPVVLAFVLHLLLAPALRMLERLRAPRMLATCSRSPRPYRRPVKSKTTTTMAMTPMTPIPP